MNWNAKYVLVAGVAVLVGSPFAASAAPITSASAYVPYYGNGNSYGTQIGSALCSQFSSGSTVTCSGSTNTPTTGATLTYSASATASYGVLGASGSSQLGGNGTPITSPAEYSSSLGQAFFTDSWTITGGTGTGTLKLTFLLTGTYAFTQINSGITLGFGLTNLANYASSQANLVTGPAGSYSNTPFTLSTQFTFGTPLNFEVSLGAGSNLTDIGSNAIYSDAYFLDTAAMSAIIVTDANGNPIPFYLTPASGAPLFSQLAPSPPSSVPEPSSLALFGAGLAALLGLSIRRSHRRAI